jgi:lysophospholipase L1-like esterase
MAMVPVAGPHRGDLMALSRPRLLPLLASLALLAAAPDPSSPVPRPGMAGWMQRHQDKLQELAQSKPALIFLGDSITQELESAAPAAGAVTEVWRDFYACRHAVNLGFRGDTTSNLLWRIENGEADGIHPRLAIVMVGTNNIRPRLTSTVEGTADGIIAVVTELRRRLPETHILLLGIPPSGRSEAVEQERRQVNAVLATHAWAGQDVVFLSTDGALAAGGIVDTTLFWGGGQAGPVHPNAEGWRRLATLIEPTVARLMGQPGSGEPCGHRSR